MPMFTIAYPENKPYGGRAASEAGYLISQVDGVWYVDAVDQAAADAVQAWLVAFDDVAYAKARAKELLAAELERRLQDAELISYQLGLLTEAMRLTVTHCGTAFNSWPASARNRMNTLRTRMQKIENISAAAELIAADINAMTDSYAISAFDPAASARWPAL